MTKNTFERVGEQKLKTPETRIKELETKIGGLIIGEFKTLGDNLAKLYEFRSHLSLRELSEELPKIVKLKSGTNYQELAQDLLELKELREKARKSIDILISELKTNQDITMNYKPKVFPQATLDKYNNPKNLGENLVGFGVGLIESGAMIGKLLGDIGVGFFSLPKNGYDLLTKKAELDIENV